MNLTSRTLADLGERTIFREMVVPRYRAVPGFGELRVSRRTPCGHHGRLWNAARRTARLP